ncbi:putative inner membrane protein [Salmonella enterica subsp. enterica serovar Enteritidis str. SL909]|nr:CaiF/GrlA family transcriptional regulator [Salmonella enterica]ELN56448.1 putative inner membrane protein [Salmonella enterica subsp. enterica serovar Enteritidis str. SL909]
MNQPLLFRTVAGRQSNHEGFYMPPGIRHLGTLSLYRAVAWWGLFLGREFTRDDVSEAFSIEPRRASGILNYICNRHNDDDICFDSRLHPVRGGRAPARGAYPGSGIPPGHHPPAADRPAGREGE